LLWEGNSESEGREGKGREGKDWYKRTSQLHSLEADVDSWSGVNLFRAMLLTGSNRNITAFGYRQTSTFTPDIVSFRIF
jgi:hypothetical protein